MVIGGPAFPIPKIPKALPCHSFGYQTEVYPIPTAKLVPTNPKRKLKTANDQKELANVNKNNGTAHKINKTENTIFPPYLSVNIPTGNLNIAPDNIGILITNLLQLH